MPRRLLLFVMLAAVVVIAGAMIWMGRGKPVPAPRVAVTPAPPEARTESPAVAPALPAPEPASAETAQRARRRAAPPVAEAAPTPAAAAPAVGILHIDSDVAGAQVFIDRNYIGVTPVTAPDVSPGPHRVNVLATGYESLAENIEVEPGPRELRFNFKDVRLDASIDVVHKHRMGSCKGRLIATPQGMRYETSDRDDQFAAPLASLEQFDVDYLAKLLRVKLVRGKRYEFSDPGAANADRLFVFHRDVDKARQRLKSN